VELRRLLIILPLTIPGTIVLVSFRTVTNTVIFLIGMMRIL